MIQHIVCFKFKPGTSSDVIEKHMAHFQSLKDDIPQIAVYSGGYTTNGPDGEPSHDVVHIVTFATKADLEIYFYHQAHQAFIEANKANWEGVFVVDSIVDGAEGDI